MRSFILSAMILVLLPVTAQVALASGMGMSAGHDLDALWSQAQAQYDLQAEDAILLLESHQVSLSRDGSCQTRVHRVVWIGTAVGIRSYADLRVPWNSDTSSLEVETLRTWRDGRWWPDESRLSDTAVVHTLPHAMDRADDYTDMRETMLLHDGVELGCIMETAYTITEQGVPARGGVFVLPRRDPAVLTELRVMAPPGMQIQHQELNGAAAAVSMNPTKGQALLWQAWNTAALLQPVGASPEVYEPVVVWSTWSSWDALAEHWMASFRQAMVLDDNQSLQLLENLNPTMNRQQKLATVAEHLNTMVRSVHYDKSHWRFAPRPASRTLSTAYGHDLDRAVLAGALLEKAGFKAEPMLIGQGNGLVAHELPRLQDLPRIMLRVVGLGSFLLDPASGQLTAFDEVFGHPFWYIGGHAGGGVHPPFLPQPEKSFTLGLSLAKAEDGAFKGEGSFRGLARFSHYGSLVTGNDLTAGYLAQLAASVVPGCGVTSASPALFRDDLVDLVFTVDFPEAQPDSRGRRTLAVGRPAGGLLDQLPGDIHLYDEARQSPVTGLENWKQKVVLRLEVEADSVDQQPQPKVLTNPAGSFQLQVEQKDGWLTLTRTLELSGEPVPATSWPDLRALLLEEAEPQHGLIIFKGEGAD